MQEETPPQHGPAHEPGLFQERAELLPPVVLGELLLHL
jgi:hypothetical protein